MRWHSKWLFWGGAYSLRQSRAMRDARRRHRTSTISAATSRAHNNAKHISTQRHQQHRLGAVGNELRFRSPIRSDRAGQRRELGAAQCGEVQPALSRSHGPRLLLRDSFKRRDYDRGDFEFRGANPAELLRPGLRRSTERPVATIGSSRWCGRVGSVPSSLSIRSICARTASSAQDFATSASRCGSQGALQFATSPASERGRHRDVFSRTAAGDLADPTSCSATLRSTRTEASRAARSTSTCRYPSARSATRGRSCASARTGKIPPVVQTRTGTLRTHVSHQERRAADELDTRRYGRSALLGTRRHAYFT